MKKKEPQTTTIEAAIDDPAIFGKALGNASTWQAWRTFHKAVWGLPLKQKEMEIFRKCTGREFAPKEKAKEVFCISGRRSGKSIMAALAAVYCTLIDDSWRTGLAPGERGVFAVISVDRQAARVVHGYIKGILYSSSLLRSQVKKETLEEIELQNGASIRVQVASFRSVRGPSYIGACLDELSFFRDDETAANPTAEILKALRPGLLPGAILFGISSAYSRAGVLFDEYSTHFGKDSSTLIWKSDTLSMNPLFDKAKIEAALRLDPIAARTEYFSEFREASGALLSGESVDSAIIPGRQSLAPAPFFLRREAYKAFCDPSGGAHDLFGLSIGHCEDRCAEPTIEAPWPAERRVLVVDRVEAAAPPFNPNDIVWRFSEILKQYGVREIWADHYAGEWVNEAFKVCGMHLRYSPLAASDLYLHFMSRLNSQEVELPDDRDLRNELLGLQRKVGSAGKDKVQPGRGAGHGDRSNAAAGLVWVLTRRRCSVSVFL